MMIRDFLWIALGGALGSVSRYLLGGLLQKVISAHFPWGTFGVNALGCLLFGVVAGFAESRGSLDHPARTLLLVGLLGGFTTFSSYTWESFLLLRDGRLGAALGNVLGQVVLGLVAVWIGWSLTARIPS